jgi:FkbM family methyltransferase|tara:strand:- start:142 stop:843 length:702 start_codon:yes stop_codon:yes gene_type:complete
MANWRQKVVDWDHNNLDWGGEEQLTKSINDAKSNIVHLPTYGSGGCIIDIGSNIGEFAKAASEFFDEVICYEAHPVSYDISVSRTSDLKNVKVYNKAVWKNSEQKLFASTPENSTGVTVRDKKFYSNRKEGYYKTVDSVSFDDLMETNNPRVIKMDIEGCEFEVLPQAKFNDGLEFLSVEFHQPFVSPSRIDKFNQCLSNLEKNGFSIISDTNLTPRKVLYFIIIFSRGPSHA